MRRSFVPEIRLPKMGLFTWHVPENRLIGDEVLAEIYGLRPEILVEGVSIESVISLIFPEDRERVARLTHASIVDGQMGTIDFRISVKGELYNVSAYGKCLRDSDGTPSLFTGAVARDISFSEYVGVTDIH